MRRALHLAVVAIVPLAIGACSSSGGRAGSTNSTSVAPTAGRSVTANTPTTRATTTSGARWTTYYGDAARTGASEDGPGSAARVRKRWTSPTLDGAVYAQPLIFGNK